MSSPENSEKPTALITGAATSHAFARARYRVIVTDILEEEGRSVAYDI